MADLPPLATVEDYQKLIGSPPPGVDLSDVLDAVSSEIRDACGWHIAPSWSETITVDGPGGVLVMLPTLHLTDVQSVINDGAPVPVTSSLWSRKGALRGCWTSKYQGVTVTMTHGYDPVPKSIVRLACSVAKRFVGTSLTAQSESAAGRSITYLPTPLLHVEMARLVKYTLPSLL